MASSPSLGRPQTGVAARGIAVLSGGSEPLQQLHGGRFGATRLASATAWPGPDVRCDCAAEQLDLPTIKCIRPHSNLLGLFFGPSLAFDRRKPDQLQGRWSGASPVRVGCGRLSLRGWSLGARARLGGARTLVGSGRPNVDDMSPADLLATGAMSLVATWLALRTRYPRGEVTDAFTHRDGD